MNIGLVVVIDADTHAVENRLRELNDRLVSEGIQRRRHNASICILIPKRNIETWIYTLEGDDVDEKTAYPKLERESECQHAVQQLATDLRRTLPNGVLPSLKRGYAELDHRLPG